MLISLYALLIFCILVFGYFVDLCYFVVITYGFIMTGFNQKLEPKACCHMDVAWWSSFGLGHGKGVHDGASVVLKQKICKI